MKLPIPQDWDGTAWCRYAICWPSSEEWLAILRGFVTLPQRGRTWDERTGSILGVQEVGREITAQNLPLREVIMACGDAGLSDIAIAIQALATATNRMAELQCCSDLQIDIHGGVQGQITQGSGEIIPIYGSQPPQDMPSGEFPPEYPNEEAYLLDKCRKANMIADGFIASLQNIAAFGTFNAISLVVLITGAIAFGIIFPPSIIPMAITVLMILTGSLVLVAQLASLLIENREEVVCILYEGDSAEVIIDRLADLIDILITGIPAAGKIAWALKSLFLFLANTDTLNQLFGGVPGQGYPDADCSGCGSSCELGFNTIQGTPTGSGDLSFGGPRTLNSVENPNGRHYIEFGIPIECCPSNVEVTIHSFSLRVNDNAGLIKDCDSVELWNHDEGELPIDTFCGQLFGLGGCDVAWECSVSISEVCT